MLALCKKRHSFLVSRKRLASLGLHMLVRRHECSENPTVQAIGNSQQQTVDEGDKMQIRRLENNTPKKKEIENTEQQEEGPDFAMPIEGVKCQVDAVNLLAGLKLGAELQNAGEISFSIAGI